ncbi:MAG: hypothetical protein R8N24_04480 [Alphaproteobacteria bacterium]|nr:hypothetical protein [Alphaproteobacteria bacterium]
MPKKQRRIPVRFVIPDQYDNFMSMNIHLGFVSPEQVHQIIDNFKTHKPAKNACIKDLSIKLEEHVHFGRYNNGYYSSLDLSGMFYPDDKPICAKCIPSDIAKAKCCARNLRTGMCQDNFIKQTLGTILFPQHYGNQK